MPLNDQQLNYLNGLLTSDKTDDATFLAENSPRFIRHLLDDVRHYRIVISLLRRKLSNPPWDYPLE